MKRTLVAGMLGLAVAGCAHTRPDVPKDTARTPGPVGMTPVPPISESINRGLGDPKTVQTALRDPEDPRWSGRAPAPDASGPGTPAGGASLAQGPYQSQAPASLAGPPGSMGQDPLRPGARDYAIPAQSAATAGTATAAAGSSFRGLPGQPGATSVPEEPMVLARPESMAGGPAPAPLPQAGAQSTPSSLSVPTTLARPGGPMPESLAQPDPMIPGTAPRGGQIPPTDPSAPVFSPVSVPSDSAVSPTGTQAQGTSMRGAPVATPRQRRGDPLLGPNPDLMPDLPPLPEDQAPAAKPASPATATAPAAAVTPTVASPAPALEPVNPPADGPASSPPDLGPPAADLGPPTGDNRTASPTQVADVPMPEFTPASGQPITKIAVGSTATVSDATFSTTPRDITRRDPQIVRTSLQRPITAARTTHLGPDARSADQIAAEVGKDVITKQDLIIALKAFCRDKRVSLREIPEAEQNHIIRSVLGNMIERTLLFQEAKHIIKDPKHFDQFIEVADQVWREEQLPPLEAHYHVDNEQMLREKLKEQDISLETMRQTFRQEFIAMSFLQQKLKDRLKAELPDQRRYYSEHLSEHDFDRPAQITWREIVVEVGKYPNREVAQQKANALYEKLRRGAHFEQLARTESDGPTSSRNQGGLMQTSPDAYAVPAVNEALKTLPISRVSAILQGENSFHIVKVENRRPEGPASFAEVQDQIRSAILEKKLQEERTAYLAKLRQKAYIRTMFDGTENEPEKETP